MTRAEIESVLFASPAEREIVCEAKFGKSFRDIVMFLEYELLVSSLADRVWFVTKYQYDHTDDRLTLNVIDVRHRNAEEMEFELVASTIDDRLTGILDGFTASSGKFPVLLSSKMSF